MKFLFTISYANVQWDIITAICTLILAIAAFLAIAVQYYQFRKQRADENERTFKNNSVILATDFDKQFEDLEEERFIFSKIILDNHILEKDTIKIKLLAGHMDRINDFFDTLGFYVKNEYIKAEVVHQYFHYWFVRYFKFFQIYHVRNLIGYEQTVWNNLEYLALKLEEIESELHGKKSKTISKSDLKLFFEEESENDLST